MGEPKVVLRLLCVTEFARPLSGDRARLLSEAGISDSPTSESYLFAGSIPIVL